MSKKHFDEFIDKKIKEKTEEKIIDWNARRDEWLLYLSQFYDRVENFLDEYKRDGKLSLQYNNKEIIEEQIGSYSAKTLEIHLGNDRVKLDPIGTILIGATGRIDLIGANGKIKFVLVDRKLSVPQIKFNVWIEGEEHPQEDKEVQDIELEWKIATPPPRIKYIDLEQDTFFDALMEVIGD
jgi:hypothetical protein